jgi:hypothetical protein
MHRLVRLSLLFSVALAPLSSHAMTLFDFNAKPTFFSFKNPETEATLALADESAFPASKSLAARYTFAGDQAYLGLAIDFKYISPKLQQWEPFTGLTLVTKAAEPTRLTVQLIVAGKTYFTDLEVTKSWTRVSLPFAAIKNKEGESFNPQTMKPDRLVLRPGRKPATNTLLVDEITVEENITEKKAAPVTPAP